VIDTRAMTVDERSRRCLQQLGEEGRGREERRRANGNGEKKAAPKKNGKAVKAAETPASV
jgi:hypothetical protein